MHRAGRQRKACFILNVLRKTTSLDRIHELFVCDLYQTQRLHPYPTYQLIKGRTVNQEHALVQGESTATVAHIKLLPITV